MRTSTGTPPLRALGDLLRAAGLVPRALAAWAGSDRLSALPARLPGLAAREPAPAALALAVFVAGAELAVDRVARLLPVEALLAAGLLERAGDRVRAPLAIAPLGRALVVCDRGDAPAARDRVCWPDDSSYHLATAIPAGRHARWLDLGCGSAFAQLARPELADLRLATDANPRALAHAALGAALSGIAIATTRADAGDPTAAGEPRADLITFNAPIPPLAGADPAPDPATAAMWRHGPADLVCRVLAALPDRLAPGGLAVIHAACDALPAALLAALPGERALVAYTPPGARAFGVLWWRPDGEPRAAAGERPLTLERPHVDPTDRAVVLASALRG